MKDFKSKTITGISWSIVNQVVVQLLNLVVTGVLARYIIPSEYGLISMAVIFTGLFQVFADFGLGAAIVNRKDPTQLELSSLFWANLFLGSFLALVLFLSSWSIAKFYNEEMLIVMTQVLSINFIITSLGSVSNKLITKTIDFKSLFVINVLSTGIAGIIAIGMAIQGYGLWSLVVQLIISKLIDSLCYSVYAKWTPTFEFKIAAIRSYLGFAIPLFGNRLLDFFYRNIDNMLIGKYMGKESLGLYARSYNLMLLPVRHISSTLTRVLFPSYTLIQDDIKYLSNIYLKISRTVAFISFPIMTGFWVLSKNAILIVYGENWLEVIPVFQVLCFLGMFQSIAFLSGDVFLALGKTGLLFRIGILSKTCMISGILIGLAYGDVVSVAWGFTIGSMLAFFPELYFLGTVLKVTVFKLINNFLPSLAISLIMGAIVFFLKNVLRIDSVVLEFFVLTAIGGVSYFLLAYGLRLKVFNELLNLFLEKYKK